MKTTNMPETETRNSPPAACLSCLRQTRCGEPARQGRAGLFLFIVIACVISFFSASSVFAQTTASFSYDSTYGGLTGYQTPDSAQVDITRNGFGRHPVKMAYDNTKNSITTTYNFQDNAAGRRVVQERTIGGVTTTSHFLFGGGLRPKVEFRDDGTAHYTIYGPGGQVVSYVSKNAQGNMTRLTPFHDRLGSTRALLDSSGSGKVEARFGYNTLGKPTETDTCAESGTGDCTEYREYPYRFQGHRYLPFEDETASADYHVGVTDNVDRLYSHDHGLRFMHTDLAGQSISPYTSYGNDPVNMVDLNGLTLLSILIEFNLLNKPIFLGECHGESNVTRDFIVNHLGMGEVRKDYYLATESTNTHDEEKMHLAEKMCRAVCGWDKNKGKTIRFIDYILATYLKEAGCNDFFDLIYEAISPFVADNLDVDTIGHSLHVYKDNVHSLSVLNIALVSADNIDSTVKELKESCEEYHFKGHLPGLKPVGISEIYGTIKHANTDREKIIHSVFLVGEDHTLELGDIPVSDKICKTLISLNTKENKYEPDSVFDLVYSQEGVGVIFQYHKYSKTAMCGNEKLIQTENSSLLSQRATKGIKKDGNYNVSEHRLGEHHIMLFWNK